MGTRPTTKYAGPPAAMRVLGRGRDDRGAWWWAGGDFTQSIYYPPSRSRCLVPTTRNSGRSRKPVRRCPGRSVSLLRSRSCERRRRGRVKLSWSRSMDIRRHGPENERTTKAHSRPARAGWHGTVLSNAPFQHGIGVWTRRYKCCVARQTSLSQKCRDGGFAHSALEEVYKAGVDDADRHSPPIPAGLPSPVSVMGHSRGRETANENYINRRTTLWTLPYTYSTTVQHGNDFNYSNYTPDSVHVYSFPMGSNSMVYP